MQHDLTVDATKVYDGSNRGIPGASQKRPPKWIRNILKTNLVFKKKEKAFLCRKGGLGYFKVLKIIPNLLMTIR